VVIAHGPCHDGYVAAWSYWRTLDESIRLSLAEYGSFYGKEREKKFKTIDHVSMVSFEKAEEILNDGSPIAFVFTPPSVEAISENLIKDRDVLIFDIDLTRHVPFILQHAASLLIIDHHASGEQQYELLKTQQSQNLTVIYDTHRSAAMISWNHYHGNDICPLAEYVQDRDLWTWKLPHSKEINEALYTLQCFKNFWKIEDTHNRWVSEGEAYTQELNNMGSIVYIYQNKLQEDIAQRSCPATMTTGPIDQPRVLNVLIINCNILSSDVGNTVMENISPLYEEKGFRVDAACMWAYNASEDKIFISVRTTKPDVNLSSLLKTVWGGNPGGGHAKAGAFSIDGCNIKAVFNIITELPNVVQEKQ